MSILANKSILIIEDTLDNLRLFRALLQLEDAHVLEALDAPAGIALAEREQPDLILMDIHLPGMDGLEATRRLRANSQTSRIPILAVTASVMPSDLVAIERAGCNGCIAKPIEPTRFVTEIADYLNNFETPKI